jgi:predicted amidohydrolase YtcJ
MVRPGYRADLVLWGEDPATCPTRDVVDLPVQLTVVDGVVVHRASKQ